MKGGVILNRHRIITGYCQTQKKIHSVVLTCIDDGMGKYLRGTVNCDFVRNGGHCSGNCSIRNSVPNEFRM